MCDCSIVLRQASADSATSTTTTARLIRHDRRPNARRPLGRRPRFSYREVPTIQGVTVKFIDDRLGLFLGVHGDEGKTTGLPGEPVHHEIHRGNPAKLAKELL
jgi:hypothetical protein